MDLSSSPTVKGSGAGTTLPESRALGRNVRQIYRPTSLLKILLDETIVLSAKKQSVKETPKLNHIPILPRTELGTPFSGTPCTVTTIVLPWVWSRMRAQDMKAASPPFA